MHNQQQPLSTQLSSLNEQRRHAYLHALGVPIWVHRADRVRNAVKSEIISPVNEVAGAIADTITESIAEGIDNPTQDTPLDAQRVVEELSATLSVTPDKNILSKNNSTPTHNPTRTPKQEPINCAEMGWETLQAQVSSCQACGLHTSRNQAVSGSGDQSAECMIIGDAPTFEDDRKGHPFVGQAGQLLTNMLQAIDLPRNTVYLTNATKCRAANDRMPSNEELTQCYPYLYRQIELVNPEKILILGRTTAQHLLQLKAPLSKLRGKVHTLPNTQIPAIVTYHPRNLLKQPNDKRKAWEDLKLFRKVDN